MLQHVYVPTDLAEAVARLAADPTAALLAGGTLLMPAVTTEASSIAALVSSRRLPLTGVSGHGERVQIGAATTLSELGRDKRLQFLQPTIESIASPLIRNLATVGGNLFAPQPYGDLAVALLALESTVDIVGPAGDRQVPVEAVLDRGLAAGEIVIGVSFRRPAAGTWFYTKAMRRKLNSASIVTVAAVIDIADEVVSSARIALGGAGPRPIRASTTEAALLGNPLDGATVATAAERAREDAQPFSDAYASAWYRHRVLPVHIRRAILGA